MGCPTRLRTRGRFVLGRKLDGSGARAAGGRRRGMICPGSADRANRRHPACVAIGAVVVQGGRPGWAPEDGLVQ